MSKLFRAALVALAVVTVAGCTSKPIVNPGHTLPSEFRASQEEVKQAILSTLLEREWSVQRVSANLVQAEITVRGQFHAEIDIPYTATDYQIRYRDSRELGYADGKIHRNYNRWVSMLDKSIYRKLQNIRTQTSLQGSSAAVQVQPAP